jgi:N-acetylmuramoyl-L-alanine amidase
MDRDPLAGLVDPGMTHARPAAPAPSATPNRATVTSVAVSGGAAEHGHAPLAARVVVSLDQSAHFERSDLAATGTLPRRVVLSIADAALAAGIRDAVSVDAAGLTRVRAAADETGTRVTLDLVESAAVHVYLLPSPVRLVADVSLPDPHTVAVASERHPVRMVLLDPGHGGDDYGARAFRLRESDLTLDLAMRTRDALLRRRPDIRVVLTRENDTFVSLEQRTAMANATGADLFVSIHLNAAWEPVDHGGVTTFVLDTTNDRQALRLAARENGIDTDDVSEIERILAGLERGEQSEASSVLADRIHFATLTAGRRVLPHLHDRGVRSAMFYVLVGATMPAVLVEASFLTREDEANALRTERYRDALAGGIADGIARYASPPE